jgi:hypothetical protein
MKLDIQALSRALIKNMTAIAKNAKSNQGKDINKSTEKAINKFLDDYKKEKGEDLDDIDLENVNITKENE